MVKKIALGTLAVAAVGTFVFGRDAVSYLRTGADNVREAVRSGVPLEFEITAAARPARRASTNAAWASGSTTVHSPSGGL